MPELLPASTVERYFEAGGFAHTAWRLETRRSYDASYSSERFRAFLRGEEPGEEGMADWYAQMRALTAAGVRVERVRLVDRPPTDYQRFMLHTAPASLAAGEDIRYLWRADAEAAGLPEEDFWVFDSRTVVRFHHDGDTTLGIEVAEEPAEVLRRCQIRDAAWHIAVPYAEFGPQVPSLL